LLNCFYKIISRAIAERLKTVIGKITNVGQKGYNSSKYCQEVLISIIDEIQTAKITKKNGALLSLDIKKAFDTISHQYINACYRFFNFGDYFVKWLNLIGTNRRACIILENDMYSDYFNLDRGNAQGDTTSPYIFNIGYQILLLKINFDLQIAGLIVPPEIPPDLQPPNHRNQVKANPRRIFAFADDGNILTLMELASLKRIKDILHEFGILSGLECNVEKTNIMPIGNNDPVSAEIRDLGFTICSSLTVLGLKINNDVFNLQENWDGIVQKVRNQIHYWSRFTLSLPGRINIAKTMLYSQINYLGCILPIPEQTASVLEDLIENFVTGTLRIAKKRLYLSPENGGLGLFEIKTFLDAQKVAWIVRANDTDEIWKIKLFIAGSGNVYNIRSCLIDESTNPILYHFACAFEVFLCGYTKHNENFWESKIFENGALFLKLRNKLTLKKAFFPAEFFGENKKKILNLTVMDFFLTKDRYKNFEQFTASSGIGLNEQQFNELKVLASNAKLKYIKKDLGEKKTVNLDIYLNRRVKGCKRYRKKIIGKELENIPHNMVKFASNTDTIIGYESSKKLNSIWNTSYFSNQMRTFLFKLHNNTAGYNNVVAHFVQGHSPNCTFCDLIENPEEEDENPLHLFYSCTVSEIFIERIFSWILGTAANISRQEFFVTFNRADRTKNEALFIISMLSKKYLWDCKQRFCLPNIENAKSFIREEIKIMINCSSKASTVILNSGINFEQG
jgi:hypothetical protein